MMEKLRKEFKKLLLVVADLVCAGRSFHWLMDLKSGLRRPDELVAFNRCVHGSSLLCSLFVLRSDTSHTSCNTRGQSMQALALPAARTVLTLHSLSFLAADRWNSLPLAVRLC